MDLLEIGRVGKAHGLKGEVTVTITSDRPERTAPGAVWLLDSGAYRVTAIRPHQHRWIVQFEGVHSREAADALHGVLLRAEPLDDPEALFVHELIGAAVVDVDGNAVGTVESVEQNPASNLLVLDGGALIPVRFVVGRDDEGTLTVDLPDGLLDL